MEASDDHHALYHFKTTAQNAHLGRALDASAHRSPNQSRPLWRTLHKRRRHSDVSVHLVKLARLFPGMRRFLPIAGGGENVDPLRVDTEERMEGMVAHVSGEVDLGNADRLRGAIQPAVSNCRNVILDMSNLRFIDSSGLYVLIDAHRELQRNKCQLLVAGASPTITRIMQIFGMAALVPVVSSLDEATALLRNASSTKAPSDR